MTAADRVRKRIKEWVEAEGHGSQRRLAQAVSSKYGEPKSDQWISDILNERADVTLRDLDNIADHLQVAPGWLIRGHDRNYEELTMTESKVLHYFRGMPDTVRHSWMVCLDYLFSFQEAKLTKAKMTRTQRTAEARRQEHIRSRPSPTATANELPHRPRAPKD